MGGQSEAASGQGCKKQGKLLQARHTGNELV